MMDSRFSSPLAWLFVLQEIKVKVVQMIKLLAWIKHRRIGIFLINSDIYYFLC